MTATLRPQGAPAPVTAICPSCGGHQPQNLLCWQCSEAVITMLAAAPALIDQLDIAASKQARISTGGKAGQGTAHLKEPVNWGAATARDELLVELALWGSDIDAIRKHPQAAEIVSGIGRAVKHGYQAIDRMQERQYLGTCLTGDGDGAVCHAELWVRPGAHQVTCTQCETTHDVFERRAMLLEKAEDIICTVREAARYIGEVGHITVTETRIRNWMNRKRIPTRPGPKDERYLRLGDLLAVVLEQAEERSA